MAAPAAAAAAGAPEAFLLALLPLDPSLQFEFVVKGGLALAVEPEGCLNSLRGSTYTNLQE